MDGTVRVWCLHVWRQMCTKKKGSNCDVPSLYIKRKAVTWYVRVLIRVSPHTGWPLRRSEAAKTRTQFHVCVLKMLAEAQKPYLGFGFTATARTIRASNGKFCVATIINKHREKNCKLNAVYTSIILNPMTVWICEILCDEFNVAVMK